MHEYKSRAAALKRIVAKYAATKTDREIARALEIPRERVTKARQRLGISKSVEPKKAVAKRIEPSTGIKAVLYKIKTEQTLTAEEHQLYMKSQGYVV